jgi:hypothetical protein
MDNMIIDELIYTTVELMRRPVSIERNKNIHATGWTRSKQEQL